jgi:hypothetical protein
MLVFQGFPFQFAIPCQMMRRVAALHFAAQLHRILQRDGNDPLRSSSLSA